MDVLDKSKVLKLLRSGTPQERFEFVQKLPESPLKGQALALIVTGDRSGMPVVALSSLILSYCYGQDPVTGALLAEAAHERAVEVWETAEDHGLLKATTMSSLAAAHAKALSLLGRSAEQVTALDRYVERYTQLGEHENLPSLRVLRIEAMLNLGQVDRAAAELQDTELLRHPIAGIEARRLKGRVDALRRDPTALRLEPTKRSPGADTNDFMQMLKTALGNVTEGDPLVSMQAHLDRLTPSDRLDSADPKQYKEQLQVLRDAETFLSHGDGNSELAFRGRVRDASAIFVYGTPEANQIRLSLATLHEALKWAQRHGVTDLIKDALWGIYLCQGRLKQSSEAADALIELRGQLELVRSGIADPMQRGGIFGAYRYLFSAMCEHLHKAGRAEDLLEAIEASKGRVIADRLTEEQGSVIRDSAIYGCVARLPDLCRKHAFHYLTVFVDDECTYAVLVSKKGAIHSLDSVPIGTASVRNAGEAVSPALWGQSKEWAPGSKYVDASTLLHPLANGLDRLLRERVLEKDDHVCYCFDEDLRRRK